jgi:large subunit ribosomal protein L31/Ran GTPase-activating protein 1
MTRPCAVCCLLLLLLLKGLEFLALQNVGCSVHACAALQELLPPAADLKGLHLFNNMSGDEGAANIGRLLSRCPGMTDFKMASSRVGPSGGISIAKALSAGGPGGAAVDRRAVACRPGRVLCVCVCVCQH